MKAAVYDEGRVEWKRRNGLKGSFEFWVLSSELKSKGWLETEKNVTFQEKSSFIAIHNL